MARVIDLRKGKQSAPVKSRQLPLPQTGGKRPVPLKARRRRKRLASVAMICIVLLALVYGAHAGSYLSAVSIGEIHVSGAETIDASIIGSYVDSQLSDGSLHFFSRRNIFLYPRSVIENGIVASFPRVKSASISREGLFGRQLDVLIHERSGYALWCRADEDCYMFDDEGFIFAQAASTTRGALVAPYVFYGGVDGSAVGQRFIPGQLPSVIALLRVFQQKTNLIPYRVDVLKDQDFSVFLEQGFYVKASFGQEPEGLSRNLELVLSSEALRDRIADIEYVDLRFGNRVYYKMKGEEQKNI